MSEPFDIEAARRYGNQRLKAEDSYHAGELLDACDEIERLRMALESARVVLLHVATVDWSEEDASEVLDDVQLLAAERVEALNTGKERDK